MVMYKRGSRVGFFERISRGWKVTKLGMAVIRADPELMVYTFLSAVLSIFAIGAAISGSIGLEIFSGGLDSEATSNEEGTNDLVNAGHMAIWFAFYLVISVITVFWNSAIIASAYERMSAGTNPSFSYGIKQAMKCLPQILIWGVISGTVGLFLQILEGISKDSDAPIPIRAVAGLASFILGIAWWIATFFVIPMIVLERSGVIDGMNQSPKLFFKTWGEGITSHVGTGLLLFFAVFILFLVFTPVMMVGGSVAVLGAVALVLSILLVALFFTTVEAVNRASLYYYAKTGEAPPMAQKYGLSF